MPAEAWRRYRPFPPLDLPDRIWPSKTIDKAPTWCSVDLRDGNQALVAPMGVEEKLEMFRLLTRIGLKEIEVAFPSASEIEFEFVRTLIQKDLIPEDVTIQVLTPAREAFIRRTFDSIAASGDQATVSAREAPTASAVIGRYESEGTSYVMYADGSIDAQSEAGVYRFASMAELKTFIES